MTKIDELGAKELVIRWAKSGWSISNIQLGLMRMYQTDISYNAVKKYLARYHFDKAQFSEDEDPILQLDKRDMMLNVARLYHKLKDNLCDDCVKQLSDKRDEFFDCLN